MGEAKAREEAAKAVPRVWYVLMTLQERAEIRLYLLKRGQAKRKLNEVEQNSRAIEAIEGDDVFEALPSWGKKQRREWGEKFDRALEVGQETVVTLTITDIEECLGAIEAAIDSGLPNPRADRPGQPAVLPFDGSSYYRIRRTVRSLSAARRGEELAGLVQSTTFEPPEPPAPEEESADPPAGPNGSDAPGVH